MRQYLCRNDKGG